MTLNITGVDNQLYYDVNVALNVCFFIFLSLLPLLLCVLVILALILAQTIHIKIRVLLINIFAAEILGWIVYAIFYLGWIVRLNHNETISCKMFYTTFLVAGVQKFTSGTLYTINIFLFIKYGEKKLKWYIVTPYIVLSWIIITIISVLLTILLPPDFVRYINGICSVRIYSSILFAISASLATILAFIFLIIQIVMIIVTFVYIKKHTLEGSVQLKKAVAKVLVYIFIASIVTFIGTIAPALSFIVHLIIPGSTTVTMTVRIYLTRLLFSVPGIATPIVAIALLKPVRDAIKTMTKNLFCKKDNKVHPTMTEESTGAIELQTHQVHNMCTTAGVDQ